MSSHTRSLRRWIVILTLTLLVLVAGMAYLLWRDAQSHSPPLASYTNTSSIRIQRAGFDDVELSRSGESWNVVAPCAMPANVQRLTPLLGALTPSAHQYAAHEVDLEAAGLITPSAIVHLDGVEHRIGNTDLDGQRRYMQTGNSVQFVPEWVLSLVNGGTSALAQLEIITDPMDRLTLTHSDGTQTTLTSADDLQTWQMLTAQQIITWPRSGEAIESTLLLTATLSNGRSLTYDVYDTDQFTAITAADAQCAYILPLDSLPTSSGQ